MLKQTISLPVKASRFPPMESTSRANCWALRVVVPLKTMCSTKWEMPLRAGGLVAGAGADPVLPWRRSGRGAWTR